MPVYKRDRNWGWKRPTAAETLFLFGQNIKSWLLQTASRYIGNWQNYFLTRVKKMKTQAKGMLKPGFGELFIWLLFLVNFYYQLFILICNNGLADTLKWLPVYQRIHIGIAQVSQKLARNFSPKQAQTEQLLLMLLWKENCQKDSS